jgi:hypothetical protein
MSGSVVVGHGPLPLEPLETYMLTDDDDRYPRTFVVGFEFRGTIDRLSFETTVADTLLTEPLLTARVRRHGLHGQSWISTDPATPVVEWLHGGALPDALAARQCDLRREPALQIWVQNDPPMTRVYHAFHHACCDGIGALAFLGRLYAAYARQTGCNQVAVPARPRVADISQRIPEVDVLDRSGTRFQKLKLSWQRKWDVLTTRTARLYTSHERSTAPLSGAVPFPGAVTQVIDGGRTRALKRAARGSASSLNDLLLCAMFQTLRNWNRQFTSAADRQWYQIMVPVNLRTPRHDGLPAANLMSGIYLKQRGRNCVDRDTLLAGVSDRMKAAMSSHSLLIMYNTIQSFCRVPGLLWLFLRMWRTQATAVVSYVGDSGRQLKVHFPQDRGRRIVGNLVLEQITATGPVRPGTAVNLTAGTYVGELILNLTLDPHQFSASDARQFMDMFVKHLMEHVAPENSHAATADATAPSFTSAVS